VCNTLFHYEGVDCKVTGIKFMTVYHAKGCGMLLATVSTILLLCVPGNSTFYGPFDIHQSDSCYAL